MVQMINLMLYMFYRNFRKWKEKFARRAQDLNTCHYAHINKMYPQKFFKKRSANNELAIKHIPTEKSPEPDYFY